MDIRRIVSLLRYATFGAVAACLLAPPANAGATLFVDADAPPGGDGASWPTAFTSLQPALAVAALGGVDAIWIAEGVYMPTALSTPGNPRSARFALVGGTSLHGGFAGHERSLDERDPVANPTILSGDLLGDDAPGFVHVDDNAYHVLVAESLGAPALVDGVTIRGGAATGATASTRRGGALSCITSAVTLANSRIESNLASFFGGGVRAESSTIVLDHCEVVGNRVQSSTSTGGGVSVAGGAFTAIGCTFADGQAANRGGGLALQSAAGSVQQCAFLGNSAGFSGGGAWVMGGVTAFTDCLFELNAAGAGGACAAEEVASVTWTACSLVDNLADTDGGALLFSAMGAVGPTAVVERCRLAGNIAFDDGGAASIEDGSLAFSDSLVLGNVALDEGGAVGSTNAATTFLRSTLAGNMAVIGGAVRATSGSLTLRGSILWANEAGGAGGFVAGISTEPVVASTIDWSCIADLPDGFPGIGNTAADPRFANLAGRDGIVGTADDDGHLGPDSPAVNRGDPAPPSAGALDGDGASRMQACRVDMGALESPFAAATPTDCDGNGLPDECDIADGLDGDCDVDGVPDGCEIAAGAPDCDRNGVPDDCQLAGGADCDGDGVVDGCAIAAGLVDDCDGSGVPDPCEVVRPVYTGSSPPLSPIHAGAPKTYTFVAPPTPTGAVTLTFAARTDLNTASELIAIGINGTPVGNVFAVGGTDCPATPDVESIVLSSAALLAATGGGDVIVTMTPSSAVDFECSPPSFIVATLSYAAAEPTDADGDGILDACEVGDLDGDNQVDGADLGLLLGAWGPCPVAGPCPADFDGDGVVGGADLGLLLAHWT